MTHIAMALIGLAILTVAVSWLRANWQATDDFDDWCQHYIARARRREQFDRELLARAEALYRASEKHPQP